MRMGMRLDHGQAGLTKDDANTLPVLLAFVLCGGVIFEILRLFF